MAPAPPDTHVRGALRIGSLAGIGVFVHWTFLILIGWVVWIHVQAGSSLPGILEGVGFVLAIFACVVLHELGHALMARRFGVGTRNITLLPIGGVANLERMPEKPMQEFWVAVAGPAVNVVIAGVIFGILGLTRPIAAPTALLSASGSFLDNLMWVNIFLIVFNMIPAFPMDGGRVLRALLATAMDYTVATRAAARIGQAFAVLFAIAGLFFNPFLVLIAVFIFFGAGQEVRAATMRAATRRVVAGNVMITLFKGFSPTHTLSDVVREARAGSQQDFPIVEDDRLVGLLARENIAAAVNGGAAPDTRAADLMRRDGASIEIVTPLQQIVELLRQHQTAAVAVTHDGALVGLITFETIRDFLARAHSGRGPAGGAQDRLAAT